MYLFIVMMLPVAISTGVFFWKLNADVEQEKIFRLRLTEKGWGNHPA